MKTIIHTQTYIDESTIWKSLWISIRQKHSLNLFMYLFLSTFWALKGLTLLHSERPKLWIDPIAFRKSKIVD